MADYLGIAPIPAVRVESACASGGLAVRMGFLDIASGNSDIVLAGGVEKMNDGADVTFALSTAADQEYECYHGVTFPGLYAMIARAHMHRYGTTRDQLAQVAVKNHFNGSMNPNAQFPRKVTLDQVKNAVLVADPLTVLDSSPVSDGGACVILASEEVAKKLQRPMIKIIGSGVATDSLALDQRDDITALNAVKVSAEHAYKMAGLKPTDIDLAEVHDCFTIAEICILEELGFAERGKGGLLLNKVIQP